MTDTKQLAPMSAVQVLATQWCEREKQLGYKGKTADKMCLEYFVGAATALNQAKHKAANNVAAYTALLIASRGAFAARQSAQEALLGERYPEAPCL